MKGKPWTVEEEKQLRRMVEAGNSLSEISAALEKSSGAVRKKLERLGIQVVVVKKPAEMRMTTSTVLHTSFTF